MSTKSAALEKEMQARTTKPKKWLRFYRCIPLYLMFLPGALYLLMDKYLPMTGLIIAFKRVNWRKGILASDWVGFSNFTYLFKTKDAVTITRNTVLYNVAFIVLGTVLAITIAILLNEITSKKMKQVYQTIILLPYLISIIVVSYLVFALLSSETGFINNTVLKAFGAEPISWYTEPKYWPFILVIVHLWKVFGYDCILYYATLVGIDQGYYEAAVIDGAGEFRILGTVVIPMSVPMIATMTLLIGLSYWNDWKNGLYYLQQSKSLYSIQVLLNEMLRDVQALKSGMDAASAAEIAATMPSTGIRMAIAVVGVLPVLIVYPFFQKYFVKGITIGAVKG